MTLARSTSERASFRVRKQLVFGMNAGMFTSRAFDGREDLRERDTARALRELGLRLLSVPVLERVARAAHEA